MGEVDPKAHDDGVVRTFEQDAGQFGALEQQVVGPFNGDLLARQEKRNDFVEGNRRDHRQAGRRRISLAQSHQRARVEIAFGGVPASSLPASPPSLALGAEPQPFGRAFLGHRRYIVVGRSRLWDGADQKSAPAAFSVAASRSGIEK